MPPVPFAPMNAPIFPLSVVPFPGMPLLLHVFEPRYRAMLTSCLEDDLSIGIFAIREGSEALGPMAAPWSVGCLASIHTVHRLPDGAFDLELRTEQRIRLLSFEMQPHGYAMGLCAGLDDDRDFEPDIDSLNAFRSLLQGLVAVSSPLPSDPLLLCHTALRLVQVPIPEKQRLLELNSFAARWHETLSLLQRKATYRRVANRLSIVASAPPSIDARTGDGACLN